MYIFNSGCIFSMNNAYIFFLLLVISICLLLLIRLKSYNESFYNLNNLRSYERKVFSQHGEDGVLLELVRRCYDDPTNKYYVEFGVETGMECNSRVLREQLGWKGLMMDGGNENLSIGLQKEFIYSSNIVDLFKKHNVPKHINVLITDIDFNDLYVLHRILQVYTADILVCEYNGTHLPHEDKVIVYKHDGMWDGYNYFGGSLLSFTKVANHYGYSLVYTDSTGTNAFFISNALLDARAEQLQLENVNNVEALYSKPTYNNGPNGGHHDDPQNRPYVTSAEVLSH